MADNFMPYHETSNTHSMTGAMDTVLNIHCDLAKRPDYSLVTHLVGNGRPSCPYYKKQAKNGDHRQEWLVQRYHELMHKGIPNVKCCTGNGHVRVLLRVIRLAYGADTRKLCPDSSLMSDPSPFCLAYRLANFKGVHIGGNCHTWSFVQNPDACRQPESTARANTARAHSARGTKGYTAATQQTGSKGGSVWSEGNPAHGVLGMPHLSVERGVMTGFDHTDCIVTVRCLRPALVAKMTPEGRAVLAARQKEFRCTRGALQVKCWSEDKASEKIKEVEEWALTRSWIEFDGLLDEDGELLWGMYWLCLMVPKMADFTVEYTLPFLECATRVFMLLYEQYAGIRNTRVSYAKLLLKPEEIADFGLPSLHSELDIDCGYKFLGDILRKCLFNGSPPENLMIKSYLRERLLDPIRQVHRQRLYRQPPAAALFHVNARIMLQELVSSESESGRYKHEPIP